MCAVQTGLERVVRMGLTIGLIVWVFQSQAEMDRRVYKNYIDIRKYEPASSLSGEHMSLLGHSAHAMELLVGDHTWHTCAQSVLFHIRHADADSPAAAFVDRCIACIQHAQVGKCVPGVLTYSQC